MKATPPQPPDESGGLTRPETTLLLVAVVALAGIIGLKVMSDDADTSSSRRAIPQPTASTVLYEVEGSVEWADITYETPTGTQQESPDVPLMTESGQRGLSFEFTPGSFVYIAAQMKDSFGTIRCRITVDGVVISENESSSSYGIATCKGSA